MNKNDLDYLRKDPIAQKAVSDTGLDMETLMREVSIGTDLGDFDKPESWPISFRAGIIQPCHFLIVRDFLILYERASIIAHITGFSEVTVRKHINAAGLRKTKPS